MLSSETKKMILYVAIACLIGVITGVLLYFLIKHFRNTSDSGCNPSCGSNQTCVSGVCKDKSTSGCNPPCSSNQTCVSGVCKDTPAGGCNPPCSSNQTCVSGVCKDKPSGNCTKAGDDMNKTGKCLECCSDSPDVYLVKGKAGPITKENSCGWHCYSSSSPPKSELQCKQGKQDHNC
jgi:hypothetical protein